MIILIATMAIIFVFFFFLNLWPWKNSPVESMVFASIVAVLIGGIVGGMGWGITRDVYMDDHQTEVTWNIYEGPNGRYIDNGVAGEYNNPVNFYYWMDNGTLRRSYDYASQSGTKTTDQTTGYALATCNDPRNLPNWLKMPWEKGSDYDPGSLNCDDEFVTFYVPEGES